MGNYLNYEKIYNGTGYDDSYVKYDATIVDIKKDSRVTYITCSPAYLGKITFYIENNQENFIDLYNKIKIGNTYTFVKQYQFMMETIVHVIDILPPRIHTITSKVKGFLNIKDELKIDDCSELVLDNDNGVRLLIDDDRTTGILVGGIYKITYVKAYRDLLYKILTIEEQ